nr:NAD(P)H-dependent oxidoreductase [uncultured Oscillibacter sp.]
MKLLLIDGCVSQRGPESRTRALAEAFLSAFREAHPEAEIETVRLEELDIRPFTPAALDERDALASVGAFDAPVFALARQLRQADKIVAAAPFWDLSFPAAMRVYIEHISANGLTYHYEADGCHGDCKASRLAYLTSGGDFERPESLGVLYWRQLAAMFGVPRFDYVFAGGLDVDPSKVPEIMAAACEQARALGRDF